MTDDDRYLDVQVSIDDYRKVRDRLIRRVDRGLRRKKVALRTLLVYAKILSRLQLCDARIQESGPEIIVINVPISFN